MNAPVVISQATAPVLRLTANTLLLKFPKNTCSDVTAIAETIGPPLPFLFQAGDVVGG